jgi:cell division inhibitor SepF
MSGSMRKLGLYLGLVEDDEDARDGATRATPTTRTTRTTPSRAHPAPVSSRRWSTAERRADHRAAPRARARRRRPHPRLGRAGHLAAAAPAPAHDEGYRITTLHPRTYNEARQIGEHFRSGTPVIMNLTEMDDTDAKRLVDFAAGLIFGLHGSIERVTAKVFLLSPEHVQVTAEDKARIAESGFFNQS